MMCERKHKAKPHMNPINHFGNMLISCTPKREAPRVSILYTCQSEQSVQTYHN